MAEKDETKTKETSANGDSSTKTVGNEGVAAPEDLEGKIRWYETKKKDADSEAIRLRVKLEEEGKNKSEALAKAEEESKKAEALLKEIEEKAAGLTTAETKAQKLDFENRRLKTVLKLGLPSGAEKFITGETDEEMEASAAEAVQIFGTTPVNYSGARGGLDPTKEKNSLQEAHDRVARIYEKQRR